jgi:UDP-N-acetylmuramoyl-L-alanyl-D-glutamate--2,6-diaminopimelate ligase
MTTTAADIARALGDAPIHGDPTVAVTGIQHDSRAVSPGDLFAVIRGNRTDGRLYVGDAAGRGAAALLVDGPVESALPQIVVDDVRSNLGSAAAVVYGHPTSKLRTIGVTGTNGKTTTVYLVESALSALGMRPGVIGTVAYRFEDHEWKAAHTTPEATVIQSVAAKMAAAGATHLVMEASSHGLSQGRLQGCAFEVVAFTNLTQDHLDFHGDMEAYAAAKLRLFKEAISDTPNARVVVNIDDPFAETIISSTAHPVTTVSLNPESGADIRPVSAPGFGILGVTATIRTPLGDGSLESPLIGEHNMSNLLVALGICTALGISPDQACGALDGPGAPGRLERVSSSDDAAVLVDYAHTPDALARVLEALRPLTRGRLICVFGCGGDRDSTKRPLMGRAVRDRADVAVVTSDNPRTERPDDIIDMILPGIEGGDMVKIDLAGIASLGRGYAVEPDRRSAIEAAVRGATPEDTVLIAGKGHEDYQILGTERIHFDDREEARAVLSLLKEERHG